MAQREKKSFARSKKFDEIKKEGQAKLRERSVQKKTGYERDIRTMSRVILEGVHAAAEGEGEITVEELRLAKLKLEKMITKTRVLSNNKQVNLSQIRSYLEGEKILITDYIQGKRECIGLVKEKGDSSNVSTVRKQENNSNSNNQTGSRTQSDNYSSNYTELGFDDDEEYGSNPQDDFFRSLGFGDDEEETSVEVQRIQPRKPIEQTRPQAEDSTDVARLNAFRRMATILIDERISKIINDGIEHLMHFRRRRKLDDLSFRDETVRFIEQEITFEVNRSIAELKNRGYVDSDITEYRRMFLDEYKVNKNWMIRKCLHMSRVLEYRKGSTASG